MKKDRTGIIVLMVLILIVIAGHFLVEKIVVKPHADITGMIKAFEEWERQKNMNSKKLSFFHFNPNTVSEEQLDTFNLPKYIKGNIINYRKAGGRFKSSADLRKIYGMNDSIFTAMERWLIFPEVEKPVPKVSAIIPDERNEIKFDPNSAGADVLAKVGFNNFQASNLINYREKGGRFYAPEDIMKIYGVDSTLYLLVKEQVQIVDAYDANSTKVVRLELNSADSLQLEKLRGIGPVLAARIIKYRNLLGGYYSVEQIREVYGFPEETYLQLKDNFEIDTVSLIKIRINFAGYIEMIRHPYLEKEHVEAIFKFRENNGPFTKNEQLLDIGILDSLAFSKLNPYITCR